MPEHFHLQQLECPNQQPRACGQGRGWAATTCRQPAPEGIGLGREGLVAAGAEQRRQPRRMQGFQRPVGQLGIWGQTPGQLRDAAADTGAVFPGPLLRRAVEGAATAWGRCYKSCGCAGCRPQWAGAAKAAETPRLFAVPSPGEFHVGCAVRPRWRPRRREGFFTGLFCSGLQAWRYRGPEPLGCRLQAPRQSGKRLFFLRALRTGLGYRGSHARHWCRAADGGSI